MCVFIIETQSVIHLLFNVLLKCSHNNNENNNDNNTLKIECEKKISNYTKIPLVSEQNIESTGTVRFLPF